MDITGIEKLEITVGKHTIIDNSTTTDKSGATTTEPVEKIVPFVTAYFNGKNEKGNNVNTSVSTTDETTINSIVDSLITLINQM